MPGKWYDEDEDLGDAYGVDAIKDANAMLGNRPYDDEGYWYAKKRGWLSKGPRPVDPDED